MINTPKIYKMRVVFTLTEKANYALIFNEIRNVVLKSGLPFEPAKVNKNWPRLAYGPALGYRQESRSEYVDVYLTHPVAPQEVLRALECAGKDRVCILRAARVPYALPSVSNLASVSRYLVKGSFDVFSPRQTLGAFLQKSPARVTLRAENGLTRTQDISPYVVSSEFVDPGCQRITLQTVQDKNLKPEYVVAAWLGLEVPIEGEFTIPGLKFIREGLFWRNLQGEILPVA